MGEIRFLDSGRAPPAVIMGYSPPIMTRRGPLRPSVPWVFSETLGEVAILVGQSANRGDPILAFNEDEALAMRDSLIVARLSYPNEGSPRGLLYAAELRH